MLHLFNHLPPWVKKVEFSVLSIKWSSEWTHPYPHHRLTNRPLVIFLSRSLSISQFILLKLKRKSDDRFILQSMLNNFVYPEVWHWFKHFKVFLCRWEFKFGQELVFGSETDYLNTFIEASKMSGLKTSNSCFSLWITLSPSLFIFKLYLSSSL